MADYYKFDVSKGDRIEISLTVPNNPGKSGFIPSFALLAPRPYQGAGFLPDYIEVPTGYYAAPVNGKIPSDATYEPFTPGWFYSVADQTYTATETGRYFIVVYGNPSMFGNYGLATGYIETFTVADWLTIPYNVHRVYMWEGQNRIIGYLLMALVLVFGGA
jgi:hypothetical protein